MKKAFVLGGTGFLGYHTIQALLKQDYQIINCSLPPMPAEQLFPETVENHLIDINELSDNDIATMLRDVDAFFYAIGADERVVPSAPALKFYYDANVLVTQRLARLAARAGVKKFIIYGSYFSEFAERLSTPDLRNQPYPHTRLLQEKIGFAEGEGQMDVMSLRLPYIFGTMPGRVPLWKMFTDVAKDVPVFPALSGGTACITGRQVGEAAVKLLACGKHRGTYPIATDYITFKRFQDLIVSALGQTATTQVPVVNYEAMRETFEAYDEHAKAEGKEHGIHMTIANQIKDLDFRLDTDLVLNTLAVSEEDMEAAIAQTLKRCI